MGAYHGGIATINARTGSTFTINMGAAPTFEGAIVPNIETHADGSCNITSTNHAITLVYEGINTDYWHTHNDHIADMTGDQFNQFLLWIGNANTSFPRYNVFSVYQEFPDKYTLNGYECFEFAFNCIAKIQELGGRLVPGLTQLPRSIMILYSDYAPVKVDPSTPGISSDLVNFFETLEGGWEQLGIVGFFEEVWKIARSGEFFFMYGEDFYYVPLKFPYLQGHYVVMPIPLVNSSFSL